MTPIDPAPLPVTTAGRWWRGVLGLALVLLGAFLVVRPFASLAVLVVTVGTVLLVGGVAAVLGTDRRTGWARIPGLLEVAAGVAVLAWPGPGVRVLAVLLALTLLVGAGADLLAVRDQHGAARVQALLRALASAAGGVLLLAWPGVGTLVLAVVFGARTVLLGIRLVALAGRGRTAPGALRWRRRPPPRGGAWRLAGTALTALVATALVAASLVAHRDRPVPDAFYTPPASVPSAPGVLLRSEPFDSPEVPDGARAWRILHTTTRADGSPAVASALVLAPRTSRPGGLVAWAHGTTGFAPGCAPSVLRGGLAAGAMTFADRALEQGWTVVATDYTGLGTDGPHPYLVGEGEARSVLDSIRAVRQFDALRLTDRTVVWGHSQGGHAALWAGQTAASYAPDVVVDGVAALAPATELPALADHVAEVTGGELFASYLVAAYAATYPEVDVAEHVRPTARLLVAEMGQRCLAEKAVLVSVLTALALDRPVWRGEPNRGAFARRLLENVPTGPVAAPLLVAQGGVDDLVTPASQERWVAGRCADGQRLEHRRYAGRDHLSLVAADSPAVDDLLTWTRDRFDGRPAADTCPG